MEQLGTSYKIGTPGNTPKGGGFGLAAKSLPNNGQQSHNLMFAARKRASFGNLNIFGDATNDSTKDHIGTTQSIKIAEGGFNNQNMPEIFMRMGAQLDGMGRNISPL